MLAIISVLLCENPHNARIFKAFLAQLTAMILVMAKSINILAASNNQPTDKWRFLNAGFRPQTWLAIFNTVSNSLLGLAFIQGVAIYFWHQACRGMTVRMVTFLFYSVSSSLTDSYAYATIVAMSARQLRVDVAFFSFGHSIS
jgi:hypothetical protein